jgi:hypothetical protein
MGVPTSTSTASVVSGAASLTPRHRARCVMRVAGPGGNDQIRIRRARPEQCLPRRRIVIIRALALANPRRARSCPNRWSFAAEPHHQGRRGMRMQHLADKLANPAKADDDRIGHPRPAPGGRRDPTERRLGDRDPELFEEPLRQIDQPPAGDWSGVCRSCDAYAGLRRRSS